jgi:hypothetical protein
MNKIWLVLILLLIGCVGNSDEKKLANLKQELELKLKTLKNQEEIETIQKKINDIDERLSKYTNKGIEHSFYPKYSLQLFDSSSIHSNIIGAVEKDKKLIILNEYVVQNPSIGILLTEVIFFDFASNASINSELKSLYNFLLAQGFITEEITYEQYALGCLDKKTQHELFIILNKNGKAGMSESDFKDKFFRDIIYKKTHIKPDSLVQISSVNDDNGTYIAFYKKLITKVSKSEIQKIESGRWLNIMLPDKSLKGWVFINEN